MMVPMGKSPPPERVVMWEEPGDNIPVQGSRCSYQVSLVRGDRAGVDISNAGRSARVVEINFESGSGTVTDHKEAVASLR